MGFKGVWVGGFGVRDLGSAGPNFDPSSKKVQCVFVVRFG